MLSFIEAILYEVSVVFLVPVLILIIVMFIYSIFQLGVFFTQIYIRKQNIELKAKGYPVFNYGIKKSIDSIDAMEIFAYKKLENTSVVTRISPMLGLVATMIPMGPALKALASGNIQGISENLIIAFGGVIFALITASITYWITTVRKRWYATEITDYLARVKK